MKRFLYWQIRLGLRPVLSPRVPVGVQRVWAALVAATTRAPVGCRDSPVEMKGVRGRKLVPPDARPGRAILYLHGGAYVIGGPRSHARLAAQIGRAAQAEVYFADYRRAPEHPFPAALDDALTCCRWLSEHRLAPAGIALAGDSAGGGLALATALSLKQAGLPPPAALVLISPWADLTLSGESHRSKRAQDPMLRAAWLRKCAALYAGGRPLDDPLLSPAFADLAGLPPMLIQAGSEEILLSDAERVARHAGKAGVRVKLTRYEGMWHEFQVHAGMLPEADRALAEIGAFLRKHWH